MLCSYLTAKDRPCQSEKGKEKYFCVKERHLCSSENALAKKVRKKLKSVIAKRYNIYYNTVIICSVLRI